MRTPDGTFRGIAAMVAAQLAFVINDTLNKLASEHLPMGEIMFLRGVFSTLLVGLLVLGLGLHRNLPLLWNHLVGVRIVGELGGTFFFLFALFHMPIANVMVIFQAVPLAVTAGAALFLHESVGWRRWAAIGAGFAGVIIVMRPGLEGFDVFGTIVLVSVLFIAFRDLATRALPPSISTLSLTLVTALAVTLMGLSMSVAEDWVIPPSQTLTQIAGASVLLTVGYATSILAMRNGDISVTACFRYVGVVFALAAGFFVWSDVPDAGMLAGTVIIIAAGLYTLYRERKQARVDQNLIAARTSIDAATGS